VQICSYHGEEFLSITPVYGGPVSSALIEELAYRFPRLDAGAGYDG
jgi:hypothetical protein